MAIATVHKFPPSTTHSRTHGAPPTLAELIAKFDRATERFRIVEAAYVAGPGQLVHVPAAAEDRLLAADSARWRLARRIAKVPARTLDEIIAKARILVVAQDHYGPGLQWTREPDALLAISVADDLLELKETRAAARGVACHG